MKALFSASLRLLAICLMSTRYAGYDVLIYCALGDVEHVMQSVVKLTCKDLDVSNDEEEVKL